MTATGPDARALARNALGLLVPSIEARVDAAIDRALAKATAGRPVVLPATVQTSSSDPTQVSVIPDDTDPDAPSVVYAQNLTGSPLVAGQRVMIEYRQRGAFVVGFAGMVHALAPVSNAVQTSQATTSAPFVDLATVGPVVSLNTLTTALVIFGCRITNGGAAGNGQAGNMSFAVTGASNITAATNNAAGRAYEAYPNITQSLKGFVVYEIPGLTPGLNIFTAKYNASGGVSHSFRDRSMTVIPLPA